MAAQITCPNCQTILEDSAHALAFEAPVGYPDVDEKMVQLFQGFVITLWKCPNCELLIVEVEHQGHDLFIGQLYNLVQPAAGGDHDE